MEACKKGKKKDVKKIREIHKKQIGRAHV